MIDAARVTAAGAHEWLKELRKLLTQASGQSVLVIRHADALDLSAAAIVVSLLRMERDVLVRILATISHRARHGSADPLLAEFTSVIDIPRCGTGWRTCRLCWTR